MSSRGSAACRPCRPPRPACRRSPRAANGSSLAAVGEDYRRRERSAFNERAKKLRSELAALQQQIKQRRAELAETQLRAKNYATEIDLARQQSQLLEGLHAAAARRRNWN